MKPHESPDLLAIARWRAEHQADRRAFTFLADGETDERPITYGELDRQARAIAADLQRHGQPQDRALLLYPAGIGFVAAFLGCIYANVVAIPVPAHFHDPARLHRTLPRLRAIARDAEATVVLTCPEVLMHAALIFEQAPELAALRWLEWALDGETAEALERRAAGWRPPSIAPDDLAFLQYSSGSTGTPKGVMVSHANLIHNAAAIRRAFGHSEASVGVSWLPAYHDMGLVADVLQPLYAGFHSVFMSPFDFVARPLRWLAAIARYRATTSGAPNFAYALCVNKVAADQVAALDLSSWEVAYDCAEPVQAEVIDRFSATFAPAGFRREAFFPYLGMAEATLMVTAGRKDAPPTCLSLSAAALLQGLAEVVPAGTTAGARVFVGCGSSLPDQTLRIVEPETGEPCDDGVVGEIWVAGPSVARGYWRKPEATAATFQARLAGAAAVPAGETAAPADGFLRTGDLGFLIGGELFITGRLKDLIIIQGQNHYPQDLERAAEASDPQVRPGCTAAFAVERGGAEQLVVVAEVADAGTLPAERLAAVTTLIRAEIFEAHQLVAAQVVLLPAGTIPKTSSGKIRRRDCKDAFLADRLPAVGNDPYLADGLAAGCGEASTTADVLAAIVADLLELAHVGPGDHLLALGGHSLLATRLAARVRERFRVELPLRDVFEAPTIAALATRIALREAAMLPPITVAAGPGPWPLSYAQERMWFLEQLQPGGALYVMPAVVRLDGPLDVAALDAAFQALVDRHASLRTRFEARAGGEVVQVVQAQARCDVALVDLAHLDDPEAAARRQAHAAAAQPFDLAHAPLMRVTLFRIGEQAHLMALSMHHIVSDGWSMGIFTRELAQLYAAFRRGEPATLPAHAVQYADYARWQRAWLRDDVLQAQVAYWRDRLAGAPSALALPTDRPRPAVETFRGASLPFALDPALTERLHVVSQRAGVTPFMFLLAAFQVLLHRYSGQADICVGVPIANRRVQALEPLIGFFVNTLVIRGDLAGSPRFADFLQQLKARCLDAYAHQDLPFEKLVEELNPPRNPGHHPLFQVMFILQDGAMADWQFDGLEAEPVASPAPFCSLGGFVGRLERRGAPPQGVRGGLQRHARCLAGPLTPLRGPLPRAGSWGSWKEGKGAWVRHLVQAAPAHTSTSKFDLTLELIPRDGGLQGRLEYSRDLFDPATVARLGAHYVALLHAVLAAPELLVGDIALADLPAPRAAAPAAPQAAAPARSDRQAPQSPEELRLCALFAEVITDLALPQVDVRDSFFDLGGHSLLATRLAARIREEFRIELPLRKLFEAPSVEALAATVRALGGPAAAAPETPAPPVTLAPRDVPLPLSFAQERLWFMDQLMPGSALYTHPAVFRLQGPLDPAALAQSFEALVARHEPLRTRFEATPAGQAVQVIDPPGPFAPTRIDLRHLPLPDAEAEAARRAHAAAHAQFDLAHAPLMRAELIALAAEDHLLVLTIHHIIVDGWAMGILLRELGTLYDGFRQGVAIALPALAVQYADYVRWQRAWFGGDVFQAQLDYWKAQLAHAPTLLALPTDRPRPAIERYHGAKRHFQLDRGLTAQLHDLARREGVTPFMVLLAAFQVLLARYSHQTDICVGVPFANRRLKEVEPMLGLFVNTLVLRGDLAGAPSFRAFLHQIKERCLDADAHQDLPFERLVEALNPPRSTSHHPLYQVMFTLQEPAPWALTGVATTPVDVPADLSKLDLSLDLLPNDLGLAGRVEYNRDLFDPATIDRLAGHFEALLRAAVADPTVAVTRMPLLTEAERRQLLVEWNQTRVDYPKDACIHALIAAQVARTPESVAVVFEGRELTYAALDAQANRLAHHLRAKGVGPDVRVGLCVERSLELVVGVLAILKAGGAYVPLDPGYPAERVRFMLRDAGLRLVLAQSATRALLADEPVETLCLDAADPPWRQEPDDAPFSGVGLDHLISVIYTSGSTGKPKGVMNRHLGVYNHLVYRQSAYPMTPDDRVIQKTSINFDGSVWELFWPLMVGARLHVLQPSAQMDGRHLCAFIQRHGITLIDFVPSMLQEVLNEGLLQQCRSLRRFFVGGESLTYAHQQQFFATLDGPALTHGYGPTETTVSVIYYDCRRDDPRPVVPIGRPIANTRLYLLDAHGELVPVGVAGELHIGGDGLARGYLDRPALTAEKFIADPFAPGEHLYKSGDLARYLPDGNVEFLGRVDQQVKIRGFRIELGEIESVLSQHPGLRDVVVLAREDRPGDKRLVAYVVTGPGERPGPADLRMHLKAQLPDHMVPAAFVFLDRLPLTPNEKVDRRALPPPDQGRDQAGATYVAPGTPDEAALCELFAEVLGVRPIGLQDDFFDLGGHSLLATQLAARIRQRLQVELPLRRLFEAPTVAELAAIVRELQGRLLPPITRGTQAGPHRLSYAQERLWFMDQLEPDSALYNIPAAYRLDGRLDVGALEQSFGALIGRHEALRTRFVAVGGQPLQVVDPQAGFALPVVDLGALAAPDDEAVRLAQAEAQAGFDLAAGPLLRARLLRLAADRHVLLLNLHHIVSDGWSWGVMMRELASLYRAFKSGEPLALPALPIQYADYARWQREWFDGEVFQTQLDYWRRQLDGAPALLQLPTDRPRPAVESYRGARVDVPFARDLADQVQALAQREGVTPFMLLLAAFQVLLHRHSGQADICVGVPIANRRVQALEPLIGFFVNTLVIRGDLAGSPRFADFLQQLKARCLDAYAHQDLPFEKLVEELNPQRSLSHHSLFQVLFVLQEAGLDAFALDELTASPIELGSRLARFDLALELLPGPAGWTARIEYNRDLFDATTIARFLGHYEQLLRAILAQPDAQVASLNLLGSSELGLLAAWNDTRTPFEDATAVHRLFEAQVARTPEAVAVVFEGRELTYAALDAQANQLAHRLRAAGAGPEVLVGLCLERSPELVVGFLAILKAGGAYLPLDPAYPPARLGLMIDDARVGVVVTQGALLDRLPAHEARVIRLEADAPDDTDDTDDADDADDAGVARDVYASAAGPDSLAYVIYTSGSTGRPKGTLLTHRGLCNMVVAAQRAYGFDAASRVLQFASPSFDASVFEILATLCNGGTLCLGARDDLMPGPALHAFIRRHRVSVINVPPSALAVMAVPPADTSLTTIIVAGEACPVDLAAAWSRGCKVFNAYGPTEATVWSTVAAYVPGEAQVPIGRPIANARAHILDAARAPVPIGVAGELYVGGPGLARGYLGLPDLSAERFIADPFAAGERLYRTGDLARYLPDGRIAFLGRVDHQIKLRGFRVEPDEIAHALASHPGVREALVMARDEHDRQALTAYVVPGPLATTEDVERARVDQWRSLYQAADGQAPAAEVADATLGSDFTGWNSSYTGAPIPPDEMAAWRDATVARIRALAPNRVYEIGCGTGLLLSQLAPGCEAYWASDFSQPALAQVERLKRIGAGFAGVHTLLRSADDFAGIAPASFDTIILNSVAQYFPSASYLRRVLAQAVQALAPGGRIFVGDVRHLGLLRPFHASVALHRAHGEEAAGVLAAQVCERVQREEELCLAPAFFASLGIPGLAVEVLHKRSAAHNELNDFRYDVILHLDPALAVAPVSWLEWQPGASAADLVAAYAGQVDGGSLGFRNIPNARIGNALRASELLARSAELETVGALRDQAAAADQEGLDPMTFWQLDTPHPAAVRVCVADDPATFAVVLSPPDLLPLLLTATSHQPPDSLANHPVQAEASAQLVPALRAHLAAQLPEHMLPGHYVVLDAFPLTPNGKVDRAALPAPGMARQPVTEGFVGPRTTEETVLCTLFAEVLGVEAVGIHDSFFELGGHSLLAIRLMARIRERFGTDLPLRRLFEASTVAALAQGLRASPASSTAPDPAPQIGKAPANAPLKLSHSQAMWWTLFPGRAQLEHGIQNSFAAIALEGDLDEDALARSFRAVIARHESLRTTFTGIERRPRRVVHAMMPFELGRVEASSEADARRQLQHNAQVAFDLERGPLIRACVYTSGAKRHLLMASVSHLVFDGWSLKILLQELNLFYAAFIAGTEPGLEPLPVQYSDYVHWHRRRVSRTVLWRSLPYWLLKGLNMPTVLDLPTDKPRPDVLTMAGRSVIFDLPPPLVSALRDMAQREGVTLYMLLLGAFQVLLHRYSGLSDIFVGTPVANRPTKETESLIGLFLNFVVLRADLSGAPRFRTYLQRVKDTCLGAYAHQDLPFQVLARCFEAYVALTTFRRLKTEQTARSNVMFNLVEDIDAEVTLGPLKGRLVPLESEFASQTLHLVLIRTGDALMGHLVYNADLFHHETIVELTKRYRALLESVLIDPDQSVSRGNPG